MANAPLKKCAAPGCRKLIRGASRCPDCAKKINKRSTTKNQAFYQSAPWRSLREAFIAANPCCCECEKIGIAEPTYIVDHIVEMEDDPSLALEWSNLSPLCLSHHNSKTARERVRRQRERRDRGPR